jgi:hypothetical protein
MSLSALTAYAYEYQNLLQKSFPAFFNNLAGGKVYDKIQVNAQKGSDNTVYWK